MNAKEMAIKETLSQIHLVKMKRNKERNIFQHPK